MLLKDEKYIHETVDILAQLIDDANLHGDPQVKINYVQVKLLMHNYVIRMMSHNTMCMHTVYTYLNNTVCHINISRLKARGGALNGMHYEHVHNLVILLMDRL